MFIPAPPPAEFWLHPADVMRFKAEAIKHLPVLIFGDRQKLTEGAHRAAVLFLQPSLSLHN